MVMRNERGFTLPELAVVVAVLCLMLAGTIFFLRPTSYVNQDNDATRQLGLAALAQGLHEYKIHTGSWPAGIPAAEASVGTMEGGYNACPYLVPTYLTSIPLDPTAGLQYTGDDTDPTPSIEECTRSGVKYVSGYTIKQDAGGAVTVSALASNATKLEITLR